MSSPSPSAPPTILITGGAGFLGREIVHALRTKHPTWSLVVYDLQPPPPPPPSAAEPHTAAHIVGDITSPEQLARAMEACRPQAVIHAAGMVPPLAERYGRRLRPTVFAVNVEGTRHALRAARAAGARAFVWTGSCCCVIDDWRHQYPNVDETWATSAECTIYGESKQQQSAAEALVLAANDPGAGFLTCSLRPSTLFGDTDSQLLTGIHGMIGGGETGFVIGSGVNLWDVCHAANVADAHVLALENLLLGPGTAAGEAFFIANDAPVPFRAFCLEVWKNFGHYPAFELAVPERLAVAVGWLAARLARLAGRDVGLSAGSVHDACGVRYCNPEKARRVLGYVPRIGLEEGIRMSCEAYAERLRQGHTSQYR